MAQYRDYEAEIKNLTAKLKGQDEALDELMDIINEMNDDSEAARVAFQIREDARNKIKWLL